MAKAYDICILGSGIVGQSLALLLAKGHLRVALVGKTVASDHGHTDVRAYALNTASRSLLQSLRCWPDDAHITPVLKMKVEGDQGGSVHFDAISQHTSALAWIADVPALEARLRDALRYQSGVELVQEAVDAPLTVVCEGRASRTRTEFGVEFDTTSYHQTAIATRVVAATQHAQVARQWFSKDDIIALLPLGGVDGREMAVVWSTSPARVTELLAQDESNFTRRLEEATHQTPESLALQGERCAWPLQLTQAQRWCGAMPASGKNDGDRAPRSWVLAGDAAHTVHPLAGQGLNLGLGDAQALARALHNRGAWQSVAEQRTLRSYERERKTALAPMRMSTDSLARMFASPLSTLQSVRNWGMRGFEMSGPFKHWMARQAMNIPSDHPLGHTNEAYRT